MSKIVYVVNYRDSEDNVETEVYSTLKEAKWELKMYRSDIFNVFSDMTDDEFKSMFKNEIVSDTDTWFEFYSDEYDDANMSVTITECEVN